MPENNKQDFYGEEQINYAMISLLSHKTRVLIVGAGRAGVLKAKHFLSQGFMVYIISSRVEDKENIKQLGEHENLIFKVQNYEKNYILDKHIVIIAVNDDKTRETIINDCEKLSKIYINCSDYKEGAAVISAQKTCDNITLGINTKYANPKGAVFILDKIKNDISQYDNFIKYTSKIRNSVKNKKELKKQVLDFIFTEDFYFYIKKEKGNLVLKLFYDI